MNKTKNDLKIIPPFISKVNNFEDSFHIMVANLPKKVRRSHNKADKTKIRSNSAYALHNFNFIGYNTPNRISIILLDFDKISDNETIRDRFPTIGQFKEFFLDDYFSDINIVTQTTRGYQAIIVLANHVRKVNPKSWKLLEHIKAGIISTVPYIDEIATKRISGLMRNPIKHNHIIYSHETLELNQIRHFAKKLEVLPAVSIKKSPKKKYNGQINIKECILSVFNSLESNSKYQIPNGIRKVVLFQMGMIIAKKLDNSLLFDHISLLNRTHAGLDDSAVEDIYRSVLKYKSKGRLFVSDPRIKQRDWKKAKNKRYYTKNKRRIHGVKMGLSSHLAYIAKKKTSKTLSKVKKLLKNRRVRISCMKKNGNWNISSLASWSGMSRRTLSKYLTTLTKWKICNTIIPSHSYPFISNLLEFRKIPLYIYGFKPIYIESRL